MELPSSLIANRDAFRRSLQSSLHDVLGDIGLEGVQGVVPQVNLASSGAAAATAYPTNSAGGISPLSPPAPSSLLGRRSASLLSQSLGATTASSLASFGGFGSRATTPEDLLLAQAAAAAAEDQLLLSQAKAALWQQTIAAQQNKQAVQEAYIQYLQNQLAATQALQQATQATASLPSNPHPLFASLATSLTSVTPRGGSVALPPLEQQPQLQQSQLPPSALATKQKIAQTLKALGTSLRSRYDPFIDCLDIEDPEEEASRRSRGGVSEHFPERLHRMLLDVEAEGHTDVVSFYSHGRAFGVHDVERFASEIMPKYFKQSKWNSFARQLNLYGFMRLASGPDAGGYYHELFLRGRPSLARYMRRVGVPQGQQDRRKCRPKNVVDIQEPDFYAMRPSVAAEGAASAAPAAPASSSPSQQRQTVPPAEA